jgi:hypothetical protein
MSFVAILISLAQTAMRFDAKPNRYAALVCLLITTLTVTACAAVLPWLQRRSGSAFRLGGLAAIAAAIVVWSGRELDRFIGESTPEQLFVAMAVTLALVSGVCAAWVVDVLRQRLIRLEEETLLVALLLAALPPVLAPALFPVGMHPRALATWALHGVFWQALCTHCIPPWQRLFPPRADPVDVGVLDCYQPDAERHPRAPRPGGG